MRTIAAVIALLVGFASIPVSQSAPSAEASKVAENMWQEAKSALVLLGVQDVDGLKEKYIKSAKNMIKRIDGLPQDKKDSLLKAEKPLTAIVQLNINKDLKGSQKIFPPSVSGYFKDFDKKKIAPGQQAAIMKFLAGTWTSDWADAGEKRKWKIGADGTVAAEFSRKGKARAPDELKLSFAKEDRMSVRKGKSTQTYVFLRHGKNFYTSSNLLYDFYKVRSKDKFLVKSERDFVLFDKGKCTIVSDKGVVTTAEASFDKAGGKNVFKLEFQYPGETNRLGKPRINSRLMYVMGDYLAHEALVKAGTWIRK